MAILSLPPIQEEQLFVNGQRMYAYSTGKLHMGGLPRNSGVKIIAIQTSPQLFTLDVKL